MQDDTTDVMSLDELMDIAAEQPTTRLSRPPTPQPTQPLASPAAEPHPTPPPPRRQPKPVRTEPGQPAMLVARIRADGQRMLIDARRALVDGRRVPAAGISVSREWLETNDNALIAATVLVTLLLLIVVAAL